MEISLKFFQKLPSTYIFFFIKFVKIVFDTYLNFIKFSNNSKIFWKASTKFQVFCKIYTNSFIIYLRFLKFSQLFQDFLEVYPNIPLIFFFKISTKITQNKYLFLIFAVSSRQFLSALLIFSQVSCKFPKSFFKDLLRVSIKLQLKYICTSGEANDECTNHIFVSSFVASFASSLVVLAFEAVFEYESKGTNGENSSSLMCTNMWMSIHMCKQFIRTVIEAYEYLCKWQGEARARIMRY